MVYLQKNARNICVAICPGFTKNITSLPGLIETLVWLDRNIVDWSVGLEPGTQADVCMVMHFCWPYWCHFHMSLVSRKPDIRVSDLIRHKAGCTATEDS